MRSAWAASIWAFSICSLMARIVAMTSFSCCQRALSAELFSCMSARLFSILARRSREAGSVSLRRASRSISSWVILRSTSSISAGRESISMRSLDGRLVDQVDGLVRQEPVGDVAVRQGGRGHDGRSP